MKLGFKRIITVILCMTMLFTASFYTAALTQSEKNKLNSDIAALKNEANEIQAEINKLKAEKNNQAAVLAAIRKKIANTQAQIDRCNKEISSINAKISSNKAEIAAKEAEIKDDELAFKKRIRAIYMSNSNSSVQILLGAENFSDFLQLSQLTSSISSHDKRLMENLKSEIEVLNQKIAENEELLSEQVSIKSTIAEQQKELESQESEAASIYNSIANEQSAAQSDLNDVNADIKAMQKKLEDDIAAQSKNYSTFINSNTGLQWPVSGFFSLSTRFGLANDSMHNNRAHNGIDIAGGGISGQPIRAMADGVVTLVANGCTHNYGKKSNCCGNGYGNYCVVNHGTLNIGGSSANYVAYYAHASKIIVTNGQYVKQGDILGYVGTTGYSSGYHLHFGVLKNGSWTDPYALFF